MTILGRQWTAEVIVAVVIAITSLLLSGYNSYARGVQGLELKVRALEVQSENDKPRLERIENKIDWLVQHEALR